MTNISTASWASGAAYEPYIGRWSRPVARAFVEWLDVPTNAVWADCGCGTGALTETILAVAAPQRVEASDRSPAFIEYARGHLQDPRAVFTVADATALPLEQNSVDVVVSGLVLNFITPPAAALAEMVRVTRPSGMIGAYVWDYAGQMQLIRRFWDAATSLDEDARALDEAVLFPICNPAALESLFHDAGLRDVQTQAIDVPTPFHDFEDYWTPFLGGGAPAPNYATGLTLVRRLLLRERLRNTLPTAPDGSIELIARAWAVRGRRS
jgi:ubiquinone/menaquinone biosynthesis C-methylase UbiE